jgi:hypothetical protein
MVRPDPTAPVEPQPEEPEGDDDKALNWCRSHPWPANN